MSLVEKTLVLIKQHCFSCSYEQLTELLITNPDNALKNGSFIDDLLQGLDIQEHTAAIVMLLLCKIQAGTNVEQMFAQISEFITECREEQIRAVSNHFATLCHHLTESLVESQHYLRGIELLTRAVIKVQQGPAQLTSIHSDLCKLCLLAKCLKPALAFLDVDISDISKENDLFDVKYYLLYFYYGGIVYCTLRNFDRAFFFFQSAISTSGSAISEIAVEALKKYVLVSLLIYGKMQPLPKQAQAYMTRGFRPLISPYFDMATAYQSDSVDELQKVFAKNRDKFTKDTNVGLVKQVISSLVKVKIQKLTKTFMTLSLADMAEKVSLANAQEAEKMILQMIEDEEVFATINQRDGMVVFLDKPEKYNSGQMYRRIESELDKCVQLNKKLKQLDVDVALNPKYQKLRINLE